MRNAVPSFHFLSSPLMMNIFPLLTPTRRTRRRGGLSVAGGRCEHGALAGKPFMSPREPPPIGPVPSSPSYLGKGASHWGVASYTGTRVGNGSPAYGTGPRPVSGEPARIAGQPQARGSRPAMPCVGAATSLSGPGPARFAVLTVALPSMAPRRGR